MNVSAVHLLWIALLLYACSSDSGSATPPPAEAAPSLSSGQPIQPEAAGDSLLPKGASSRMPGPFEFHKVLPRLSEMVAGDEEFSGALAAYAGPVVTANVASEEDLLRLVQQREKTIIPGLQGYFEQMDPGDFVEQAEALSYELSLIGLAVATVEGMYGALVPAEMLTEPAARYGSGDLQLYLRFLVFEGQSRGGEYPYSDMEPFRQMLLTGEKMMAQYPQSSYYREIEPRFRQALTAFTSVFMQRQGDYLLPLTGDPLEVTEFGMTETETHKLFLQENQRSRYHPVVAAMMQQLSVSALRPEHLYLIVAGWAPSRSQADQQRYALLDQGKDVLHCMKVQRGDGSGQYALVLRFFDNEELANPFYEAASAKWPDLRMLMVSFHKGRLYQLGI